MVTTTPREPESCTAELGSTVWVRDAEGEEAYTVVTRAEADIAHGRISAESPVGRAILGHRPGDEIEVVTPGGVRLLTIARVSPPLSGPPRAGGDSR
jgi:transcription elongation factor GreA